MKSYLININKINLKYSKDLSSENQTLDIRAIRKMVQTKSRSNARERDPSQIIRGAYRAAPHPERSNEAKGMRD